MKITKDNLNETSSNQHIIDLLKKCLDRGDILVINNDRAVGQFVCTSNLGPVQRVKGS